MTDHNPLLQLTGDRCPCDRCKADRAAQASRREAPAELWLQVDEESSDVDDSTWCRDKINDSDVRYVRADLAGVAPASSVAREGSNSTQENDRG